MSYGNRQDPIYDDPVEGYGDIQALDNIELKQLSGLNIQGEIKAIYIRGELAVVLRVRDIGGDKLVIGNETWLVVKILEKWPLWTKAAIVLQVKP